jgi:hypothetical protein
MNRLFGILIICLSLLFGAILKPAMSFFLLAIVFIIGVVLYFSNNRKKESSLVPNEEIEKELEEYIKK